MHKAEMKQRELSSYQARSIIYCSTPSQLLGKVLPMCGLQRSSLTEPGLLYNSNRDISLMATEKILFVILVLAGAFFGFFCQPSEHYQLLEPSGKHSHKAALKCRGDQSLGCLFQQSPIFDSCFIN